MGGVKNVKFVREDMSKVNRVAFNAGMLARKLRVPTFYDIGADVIGVAGKALIKGYDAGGVRRMIDQTLRWQAGAYPSVIQGQRQHGAGYNYGECVSMRYKSAMQLRDDLFYGILKRKEFAFSPFVVTALQKGKTAFEKQPNTWAGKPIENGTPFKKGWLSGISGDEQGLLASRLIQKGKIAFYGQMLNGLWTICSFLQISVAKKVIAANRCDLRPLREDEIIAGVKADEIRMIAGIITVLNPLNWLGLQKGKTADVNNDTSKPIENGTGFKNIDAAIERDHNLFMEAYRLAAKGSPADIKEAKVKLNQIINARDKYSDSNIVIAAEDLLEKLGK